MRLNRLTIENFKGITHVDIESIGDAIVIAGPNGSGKSSLFDAIRLWKSAYGSYGSDEMQQWFSEHGLQQGTNSARSLFQDPARPMYIYAELQLAPLEKDWISKNAHAFLRNVAFRRRVPQYALEWNSYNEALLSPTLAVHAGIVQSEVQQKLPVLLRELTSTDHVGRIEFHSNGAIQIDDNELLSAIFSIYDPVNLGRLDYHGPQRSFARENLGGISLNVEQSSSQRQQSALYNYNQKYTSVKSELSSAYVRDLIANKFNDGVEEQSLPDASLIETVHEMFQRFFPAKQFLGVQPTAEGQLTFNVQTAAGVHDINELSSGEKELIYGYLRLRNEAPKNSIIMLDEPELHLNPKLTKGLPDFYRRHIGLELGNQIWLVTHSDSILRQAVEDENFSAYHMHAAGHLEDGNQLLPVEVSTDLDSAVMDLIGDLPGYVPKGATVFLEGSGETPFDENMVRSLFPEFSNRVNLISAGDKKKVALVHDLLERASSSSLLSSTVFSVCDLDDGSDLSELTDSDRKLTWDRYHIENYLLEPQFIAEALADLGVGSDAVINQDAVEHKLAEAAKQTLPSLISHKVESEIRQFFRGQIKVSGMGTGVYSADKLITSVEESYARLETAKQTRLSVDEIRSLVSETTSTLDLALTTGEWRTTFRGRDVLKRFVGDEVAGVNYERFRNLVLSKMTSAGYKPLGMARVIDHVERLL